MEITPYEDSKLDAIVRLSLRAWEPVFASLRAAMPPGVYRAFYRDGWSVAQRTAVESVCADEDVHVWVASDRSRTVGFVALKLHPEDRMGEIYMIAVNPAFHWDFRFARPGWPLYTPKGSVAHETLVRHSIVPLQRPSAQRGRPCDH